jgi:Holliday junction DNA helicase RuvA
VSLIDFVRGQLVERGADWAVIAAGPFGVRVLVPGGTASALPQPGNEVMLFTYLQVREDALTLYGFATREERSLFTQLLTVSGVGPRLALDALSAGPADRLAGIIAAGDVDALARIRGIGKKTAQRIVLDLKGKLVLPEGMALAAADGAAAGVVAVAEDALRGLGFAPQEIASALSVLPRDRALSEDEAITMALRHMGRRT